MTTIEIKNYIKGGQQQFDRCELQRIIGISHRGVWRKYLIASGFDPDDREARYTWNDVPIILSCKIFLASKRGLYKHKFTDFLELRESDQLSLELLQEGEKLTEEKKNAYQNNPRTS